MTTDGGGFILVGRTNGSKTWSVPSNSDPVEPYGEPHWLSSLGDAPIMDFRVQMATSEDFKDTKAHWWVYFMYFKSENKDLTTFYVGTVCSKRMKNDIPF
jgi:hypothetical protein